MDIDDVIKEVKMQRVFAPDPTTHSTIYCQRCGQPVTIYRRSWGDVDECEFEKYCEKCLNATILKKKAVEVPREQDPK